MPAHVQRVPSTEIGALRRVARHALAHYGIRPTSLSLLANVFNTTFTVRDAAGERYVLHILRPDLAIPPDQALRRVRSELWLLDRLAGDDVIRVPRVVPDKTGRGVVPIDTAGEPPRLCTLFRWVPGRFFADPSPAQLRQVGRLTAHLHNQTVSLSVPGWFDRPRVDRADFETEDAVATSFGDGYSTQAADLMHAAFRQIRAAQDELAAESETFGLIHADIHQNNYLFDRGEARLIDFGDAGWGHYLYDLGVTIQQLLGAPNHPALRAALIAGYREVRDLSPRHEALIDRFMMVREIQDLTWLLEERNNPTYRAFASRLDRGLVWLAATAGAPFAPVQPETPKYL